MNGFNRRLGLAIATAVAIILGNTGTASAQRGRGADPTPAVSAIATMGHLGPVIKDGMLEPVAEYADTTQWIKQRVWVETNFDSDHDGKPDRIHADIVRSLVAEKAGIKLPVLMLASPYIGPGNGDVNHDVVQELGAPAPHRNPAPYKPFLENPPITARYAAEWVPRGLIAVNVEAAGTGLSTGCPTAGDSTERNGAKFVIDWLNGRAKAYTTVDGNVEVSAASWTNGKVGMVGGSYEGVPCPWPPQSPGSRDSRR